MDEKKLLLLPWFPGQNECSWPAVAPVWIRLKGIPYHCWSSDILLSIPSSIGKPLRLDETTASQRILSYARVLVNLDVAKPSPNSISVHLEGEGVAVVEVDVQYENIPCSECLFAGHLTAGCPYAVKPGLLKLPAKVIQTENPPPSTTAESAKDASIEDTQIPVPTSEISAAAQPFRASISFFFIKSTTSTCCSSRSDAFHFLHQHRRIAALVFINSRYPDPVFIDTARRSLNFTWSSEGLRKGDSTRANFHNTELTDNRLNEN